MARWFDEKEAQRRQAEQEAARAHKAAQESLRPASEQKVKTAPLVVNLDKQTNQSAARVASRIPDETERDGFLNEYIAHVKKQNSPNHQKYAPTIGTMRELTDATVTGGVYADTRAKNEKQRLKEIETQKAGKTAMVELAEMPLMGFDGQSINANTADAATVIRGINSIADDTLRERAAKAFKTLAQTEGSRFYGESTDGVGTFIESANLTRDEYRNATDDYASRFYGDGKHNEEDAAAYLEARQEIEESEYSDYAKSQLTAALDKAYTGITGGEAPSVSADDASANAADVERAAGKEQEKEKKPGFWSGLTGKVPEQDKQADKQADEQTEEKAENPEQAKAQSQIVSQTMTASTAPGFQAAAKGQAEESGKAPEVQGPVQMTPEERIIAQGGMSFAEWMAATPSVRSADETGAEMHEAQTIGQAADALLKGRYDQIEGAGKDELDRMLAESGNARRMIGTLTEADSKRILVGNDMADAVTYGNIAAQGQTVKTLYDVMKGDSFPDELRGDVMAQMVVWAAQAEAMEQTGTLGGDAELPLMERLLTTDEHAMDELESIYAARDELLADKADMRRAQEETSAQALSDARTAALKGTASEEQLALVRQNAQAGQDELNADMGYVGRLAAVDDYFRPGASKGAVSPFDSSSVKLNLDAQGVIDTGDYQAQLREQMDALLEEDTQTALALGLTLDEYYAKTGGVDMNALCERAASRISQQGAAITDEEMAALDVPFGQGVGAGYMIGAGVRTGVEQWYLDFKDSLYTGYSQGMVLVNAARIQNRYQNEYGAYGRTQYRKDIENALNSGTLDENYAEALRKALVSAADVYQLGIDPMDFDGDFLKNSAEIRRDVATMEGYMRTNATADEYKWFGRVKSMTYNAVSAGVAAGTTMVTGNSLLGFNTGYSVVGFKNNFDEYLQKGYSIDSARYLGAVNTGLDCAANVGTFEGVLGRMTGMSALTEAARSQIIRNPAGASRGLAAIRAFGKAFGKAFVQNEIDETVFDEFKEGLGSNWTDNALGEIFRKVDAGEDITFTDGLNMALNLLNPKNLDVMGAAEGVVSGAVENAIGAVLFSLSGAVGSGVGTLRGVKAAQDLMNGKRTDVENVILDVTKTLGDEQACALLNDYARQQKESKAVAEEIISGRDERGSAAHAAKAKQQADEARAQAEAAQTAADAAKSEFEEFCDAVMAGDLDKIKDMQQARVRMGENQKTANEQGAVATRRTDEMQQAAAERLAEARQAGRKAVIAEDAAAREAMLDDREQNVQKVEPWRAEMETMSQLADIDAEMDAMRESYTDAETMGLDRDVMQAIEGRLDELRRERIVIAMPGLDEATQTREWFEQRLAQAQELELDGSTLAEMAHQVELARAKEHIYRQSRSDWELEEMLYPGETGGNKSSAKPIARYANYANPDAEVQLTGGREQSTAEIAPEENYTTSDGRPGRTVVSTTFEEQYAPELKTMDAIIKAGRQAEELAQALKNGEHVSAKQIKQVQRSLNESLSKLDDNALDVFASEINDALNKAGMLSVSTDEAKERDTARLEADYEHYMEQAAKKQLAAEHYNALSGVAKKLSGTNVFINGSQAADILHMTGMKTISQVNSVYGTRFTQNRVSGAIPLDGQFYIELTQESGGYMDAASLNPAEDIMHAMMGRKQAYHDMRQRVAKPKDRSQIRRAAKSVMEGDVGKGAEGEQKRTYRGIEVEKAEGKSKKGDNIVKTVKQLAHDIGVGSTLGARNMKEADGGHGLYREAMRYMATDAVSAGRTDITMHEIGHAISERTGITGTPEMVAALKAENASWGQNYTNAEMSGEAMAEFTWRYMISDEAAKDFAGEEFVSQFEQAVADAGMEKPIAKAKTDIRNYLNKSFSERVAAMVVDRSDIRNDPKIDEAFLFAFVDSTAPAEKANKIIRDATGEKVVAFEDNLRESALLRNTADKRAYAQLTESLTDVRGTRIGDSLKDRIKDAGLKGKDFAEWLNWMLVKHSLDRDRQGKSVFDNNTYPQAERLAYIRQTEMSHPEFAKAQAAFQSFRHEFMQAWMVDTGYLKDWQLREFEAMYPSYVPTNRVKDNAQIGSSRSGGGKSYTIRSAKGSTEQIVNPFDSFCEMTQRIVRMNMDNQTNLMFDRLYKEYDGFGILGRPIEQTVGEFSDEQTLTRMEIAKERMEKGNVSEDVIADILVDIDADRAKFVGTANENNVITVQHPDGRKTYYTITDPLFYKMLANATDSGKSLLNVVGNVTHAMSALTTGSNPVFAVRNFLRDFQNSVKYGTWANSYVDGMYKWLKAVWEILTDENAYKDYVALGGGGWTRVETGKAKGAKELRSAVFDNGKWSDNYSTQTLGGKGKWAGKKLWEFATLAQPNEVIEQASRFVEYRYGKHDLTTDSGRAKAFRAAQEVTVDFSRKGASSIARDIGNIVPFFNASLQGVYRTARQGTKQESGQAGQRFIKTLLNTGVTVALANAALLCMDDDDKEAFMYMSDDLKSKHFFIPNFAPDVFGDAPLIRIPVEQDPVAYAVNALMTNVLWQGEGDDWAIDFTASMATIADGLFPISGTIFDPIISTQTNKNWYGSRIVPSYMEGWDASTQYTEDTAGLFVLGGRGLGVSPMMLQYVAQQYTGYLGQVVIPAMSDMEASNPATALLCATRAYARQQLTSDPLKSNNVVSRVYDNNKFLGTVVKAGDNGKEFNMLRGDLTPRQAQKAYDVAYDMTHKGGVLYEAKQAFSEGYEKINAIGGRDDLTDEEKYELINGIRMKMCRLALKANEAYAKFEELYVTGESLSSHIIKQAYGGTTIKKQK